MMKLPLVSVIVPCYQVEKYLPTCIDSILRQTYSRLEILLVDDGSPDRCGEICDAYALKDDRIKVIHKQNGGLSDARNVAIDQAKGEWITFIDSDDFVADSYVETLYGLAMEYGSDCSVCRFMSIKEGDVVDSHRVTPSKEVFSPLKAVELMFYQEKFDNNAHSKLYHRRLFESGIRYPKGLVFEDLATTYRLLLNSHSVAYTDAQIAVNGSPIGITFGQDQIVGNFDHPAIWTKSENVEQLIPVHLNWNWIAFGVVPKSPYLDHIFADYADWQLLIKDRTLFSDYNGAEWNGTLQPVANAMYKLRIDRLPTTKKEAPNSLLAVSGRQLKEDAERAVTLSKGWNWIAYTPLTTMTVDEALAAANPQTGDIVKSQTAVAIYGPYGWEGSLKALEGGHGYLYFTNDSTGKSFLYPAASSASAKARMAAPRRAAEEDELRIFHPVELGLYPSNMTMVIRLLAADGSPVDTCEVGAFIGDECRGAARASSRGLYYLVISGEGAGQPMTLRSCIDGEVIDIDNSLMYVSEDNIGTSWDPYVIDLSRFLTGIIAVDGSPTDDDSDWYTLQGFKIGRRPTQPGVYIHRGEKVVVKRKK